MSDKGKYLYCITKKEPRKFDVNGIEGKDVYAISEDGLSVVVSDSEMKEYFITRENLLAHQKVIEAIFANYEVLPISFGTVAKSIENVKEKILKPKVKELRQALEETKGKAEVGLKVSWLNMNAIFQEVANSSQELKTLKASKNVGYQDKIAAGQLVAELIKEKREQEKENIVGPLCKIAEEFKEKELLSEDMIFNGAFLINRKRAKEMVQEIKMRAGKYEMRAAFTYTDPLPLFNFVKINISL